MGKALYRKYRSKNLSEIVGQEHITRTLASALKSGKISHAYLFTGPRGTGKTSVARILAHEINQLPYTDESTHLDIIEIDAASNRRIDEIRDLREKVHIAPAIAKYKVYIIDEVHMLTREAFNALLKTLEEPPAHVIFILATTEIHKLPETIISRTQRFTFKLIDKDKIVDHLMYIAEAEGMNIDKEALELIAAHGRGSFRDSISLLDQIGHSKAHITLTEAENIVGAAAIQHISILEKAVLNGTAADIFAATQELISAGVEASQAARQLSSSIRQRVVAGEGNNVLIDLLGDLIKVPASMDSAGELEVALFKAHLKLHYENKDNKTEENEKPDKANKPTENKKTKVSTIQQNKPSIPASEPLKTHVNSGEPAAWWNDVLDSIKKTNNTLYGVLRMAEAAVEGNTLFLKFGFGFHTKKAADSSTQSKIHEAVKTVTGSSYNIKAIHEPSLGKAPNVTAAVAEVETTVTTSQDISSITNIFGSAEVLES